MRASSGTVADQLLAQVNELRAQHGLPPYALLAGLNASANKHNLLMASCGLQHQCPGEADLGTRISAEGVQWTLVAENIAVGTADANPASILQNAKDLTMLMYNEPADGGHRLSILSPDLTQIGIDAYRAEDGRLWLTQDFSK